jgi:hypothetical protein
MRLLTTSVYTKPLSASVYADNGFYYPHPHSHVQIEDAGSYYPLTFFPIV